MEVAKQDISKLLAYGWVPPAPITVKARDGKTDLYGLMFKPTHFDASKKYPIVNYVYPGPQTGSCGSREFSRRASRHAVTRRAGIHRRLHRRHGHAFSLEDLSRGLLRQSRRQYDPRPGRRHEGSRRAVSLHRSRSRRHVRPLRRRQRNRRGHVPLSRLLQGRHRRKRQSRSA